MDIKTAPFNTKDLHDIFKNKPHINLDVRNSSLKGEELISYLTNMKVACSLVNDPELTYEEKEELLRAFITYKYSTTCDTLLHSFASTLMVFRDAQFVFCDWMSEKELKQFADNNKELLEINANFIDGMLVAIPMSSVELKPAFLEAIKSGEIELMEKVTEDDKLIIIGQNEIGSNSLGLLTIPDFLELFISSNSDVKLRYFKYQVENLFYKQQSLYDILIQSTVPSASMAFLNVLISNEQEELDVKEKYFLKGA